MFYLSFHISDKVLEQTNARQKELTEQLDESEHDRKCMKAQIEKVRWRNSAGSLITTQPYQPCKPAVGHAANEE